MAMRSATLPGKELNLLDDWAEQLHELLAGMVVDALVSGDDDARVRCKTLHLLLHFAGVLGAAKVASSYPRRGFHEKLNAE